MAKPIPRGLLYALFALSGFAGLIYESIWSHYLKLMLGHAAYAQTLVLMIFMGGMAIGSWLTGRFSQRVARPLLWYAGIEALLGLAALLFDRVFRLMQQWLFDAVIVDLESGLTIDVVKWGAAALLTLPQAIMLGATFPLMSAGLLRQHPDAPGSALSWLYFTNSLGASVGVLASGFYLIGKVGLPGTILTAGLVNFLLAAVVYWAQRDRDAGPVLRVGGGDAAGAKGLAVTAMLLTAFLTGAASFMYEIGWIRMLSLVLGSATHSFELMLSAFILGLALGSFYIRKRIDASASPLRLLGWIQMLMALLALLSLPLYMQTFDAMAAVFKALTPTGQGYTGFTLFSHLVCLALMLPVTFCAGMTLPLITAALLRAGHGEGSIGRVYAANTVGAIVGVLLAVHVVMPLLGLRLVVVAGALIDLGLGVWLLWRWGDATGRLPRLALAAALVMAVGLSLFTQLDPLKTSSGVFRHGNAKAEGEILFHRDGKTATIDVRQIPGKGISIATNGKPDAAFSYSGISPDDYTMVLLGAVPMAMLPQATDVGVIGMGSGRTTHVLLSNPGLQRVDTVEIEPAMVEGARQFGKLVERTFSDPRSHIVIEDAKTYFSRGHRRYDLIISEPSNPWVSGVATLFSAEFYGQVRRYLKPGGLFVQWVHLYEIDAPLISTIFNALGSQFQDYAAFYTNGADMLIVASPDDRVPPLGESVFQKPEPAALLKKISVGSLADLEQRRLGNKSSLASYFASFGKPANSDYFPVLDQGAAASRFMRRSAREIASIRSYSTRLEERRSTGNTAPIWDLKEGSAYHRASLLDHYYAVPADQRHLRPEMERELVSLIDDLRMDSRNCEPLALERNWLPALKVLAKNYAPYLAPETGRSLMAEAAACRARMSEDMLAWLDLLDAQARWDWPAQKEAAGRLLEKGGPKSPDASFLLAEYLLAAYKAEGLTGTQRGFERFVDYPRGSAPLRYLISNTLK